MILFSIHSDDGNPSRVNIKQHCTENMQAWLVLRKPKDEEEVSSDDNEMVEVKVLMTLVDDESGVVGKESSRNDEWVKISMRKKSYKISGIKPNDWLSAVREQKLIPQLLLARGPDGGIQSEMSLYYIVQSTLKELWVLLSGSVSCIQDIDILHLASITSTPLVLKVSFSCVSYELSLLSISIDLRIESMSMPRHSVSTHNYR
ncbi:hypothetical protein Tco_0614578 [Tanacetum coccineum]